MLTPRKHLQVVAAVDPFVITWLFLDKFHFENSPYKQSKFEFRIFLHLFTV
jgi:hypothetical protein